MEDLGLIPGLGRSPGEGNDYPPQYSCLENSMGRGDLWGCKESDATERLSHSHTHFCIYKKTGARKKQFKVNLPKMDITVL